MQFFVGRTATDINIFIAHVDAPPEHVSMSTPVVLIWRAVSCALKSKVTEGSENAKDN